jgi:hypothetical protein
MIIQNSKLAVGDIVVLKPVTGNDIIGRLSEPFNTSDTKVSLSRPVEAHMVQDRSGGVGLAFAPFSLAARDEQVFHIPVSNLLVSPFLARDEVKKTYNEQTTSLAMPEQGLIL